MLHATALPQQETPRWQETGFAESVACAAVHYAGQPYYPENPQSSRIELAVPWDTATALVHLLSALLVARLTGPTPSCDQLELGHEASACVELQVLFFHRGQEHRGGEALGRVGVAQLTYVGPHLSHADRSTFARKHVNCDGSPVVPDLGDEPVLNPLPSGRQAVCQRLANGCV